MGLLKKSDQLEMDAMKEDNDLKAFSLHQKSYKQRKKESFEEHILPKIKESEKVSYVSGYDYFWKIGMKSGEIYDYYPIKNKLHKNKPSTWYPNRLKLILQMI